MEATVQMGLLFGIHDNALHLSIKAVQLVVRKVVEVV
jgi:hypothetical protein